MKKIVKLVTTLGILSLLFSFASCDLPTESELLGGNNKIINRDDPVIDDPGSGSSTLWSRFDGADMQVWGNTATLTETEEGLNIESGNAGWWGMCFCNSTGVGAGSDAVTFDMSKIKKITFEAKASENATMWASQSDATATVTNQTKINLSTSYATKEFVLRNPGTKDYGVLDIGGGDLDTTTKSDVVISIKNIKFLDANGNETVPTRNE